MKNSGFVLLCVICACSVLTIHAQKEKRAGHDTSMVGKKRTDLPEPYATKSARNFSEVLGWENNSTPKAPDGFKVTRFGTDYNNPRWLYVLPNGDVLVAETKVEPKGLV